MTARSLGPTTARGEATRQRVLEAAEQVFGAKGYHGASVTEITRAAGVAQGTFYLYFRGKKEIFLDLVDDLGDRLRLVTMAASADTPTYAEAQRRGFEAFFDFARGHRHIYRIIQECDRVDPTTYRRFYSMLAETYRAGAADAAARGELGDIDPEVLAYCLLGVGHFVALRFLQWDDQMTAKGQAAAIGFVQRGSRPA
ncbi:MAG TPA: TetR/AcrR family transcriptional regulator [Candidatus Dormibacteraeota bacterium]|nr:TetR/AcrR family transcriptional regulator [Candidatus Dormibacteraeota bacterium]